jgi:hypothetical protein
VNDVNNKNSFLKIFPNPVSFSTQITLLKEHVAIRSISVFDIPGHCVFEVNDLKENSYLFNKESLRSGLYFLKVEDSEGIIYPYKIILN